MINRYLLQVIIICVVLMTAACERNLPDVSAPLPLMTSRESSSSAQTDKASLMPETEEAESEPEPISPAASEDWRLILVNASNPIPDDFTVELEMTRYGYEVDKRIVPTLEEMVQTAEQEGVNLLLCYGYRTLAQSQQLFEKQINRQMALGLSYDEAVLAAAKWVAPPGYSEHHTGLAVDIVTLSNQVLSEAFAQTDAAKWMAANAHRFGFVIRYPKDKQEITGIAYEPWHLRYVGDQAAQYMYENNLCLEEYLD